MLKKIWNALAAVVKAYPAIAALLLQIAVVIGAKLGFNLTPDQVLTFAGAVGVFLAAIVHNVTVPKASLKG